MTQAMFGVGKTGRALYSHLRNSEWQRKTVGRESHDEIGIFGCPRLVEQLEGCCGILRVTGAGLGYVLATNGTEKSENSFVQLEIEME